MLVVDDPFVQRAADTLRDSAHDLALDDPRIDDVAAVVDHGVPPHVISAVTGSVSTIAACTPDANVDVGGE